jgi:hypothetical protein
MYKMSYIRSNMVTSKNSQEIYYVTATATTRLMLFGETVAVYCENHMEHINTLCGQNAVFLFWLQSGWYK